MTASSNSKFSGDEKNSKSTTAESRRASKPLMEKRRRARINQSLAVLKSLIVDSQRVEGQKHSKIEKADILEMTVSHLQSVKKSDEQKFMEGFEECFSEAKRFLQKSKINSSVVDKLTDHLKNFQQNLEIPFTSSLSASVPSERGDTSDVNKLLPLSVTLSHSEQGDSSSGFPLNVPKVEPSMAHGSSSVHSSCHSPCLSLQSNDSNNNNFTSPPSEMMGMASDGFKFKNVMIQSSSPPMVHAHDSSGYHGDLKPLPLFQTVSNSNHPEAFVLNLSTHTTTTTNPESDIIEPMDDCEPLDFSKPLNLCKHPLGYWLSEDGVWRPW